jgi:hypothetical protein
MHHREFLADMARLACETIQALMAEAVGDPQARPGVLAVPQNLTFFGLSGKVLPKARRRLLTAL